MWVAISVSGHIGGNIAENIGSLKKDERTTGKRLGDFVGIIRVKVTRPPPDTDRNIEGSDAPFFSGGVLNIQSVLGSMIAEGESFRRDFGRDTPLLNGK